MAAKEFRQSARAILMLPIDRIDVPADRMRSLKEDQARAIGRAIAADRQYDPITVRMRVGTDRFWLVDGLHRFEGCRLAGLTEIEARMGAVDESAARRQEILSAWARAGHDAFDKAAQIAATAKLFQDNPEAADFPLSEDENGESAMIALAHGWDAATAATLNIGRRNLFNYLKIDRHYDAEGKKMLRRRGCAGELVPLLRLAALPPEDFEVAMRSLDGGEAASIAEAIANVAPAQPPSAAAEKATRSLLKKIVDWNVADRKRLISELLANYDRNGNPRDGAPE